MSCHGAPGRLALLVGSGVSSSAGIPTGWQVVNDLATRLAVAEGVDPAPPEPIRWYVDAHGQEPDYSGLLGAIAPTSASRRDLLGAYFEPTEEDRAAGLKVPTAAHQGIAALVSRGVFRVIVTTNFDRLMEQALRAVGVEPVVISSGEDAIGAVPLVHSPCTVVKVHGDYLNPNIKNTVEELDHYHPALDRLLDQVVDEYGLVVVGWSGTWDRALRTVISRAPNRRYPMYWAKHGSLGAAAQELVRSRDGIVIEIDSADILFSSLVTKIEALDDLMQQRRTGVELVTAEIKRFVPDPLHRIRLHDAVRVHATRATDTEIDFTSEPTDQSVREVIALVAAGSVEIDAALLILGRFGDESRHRDLARTALGWLSAPLARHITGTRYTAWLGIRRLPALLGWYSAGIGACAGANWPMLGYLFTDITVVNEGEIEPIFEALHPWAVLEDTWAKLLNENARLKLPGSEWLRTVLLPLSDTVLGLSPLEFDDSFDAWEYAVGASQMALPYSSPYIGRHVYARRPPRQPRWAFDRIKDHLDARGSFAGVELTADTAQVSFDAAVKTSQLRW